VSNPPDPRTSRHVASELVHPDEDLPGLLSRLLDELPVGIILYDARADFRITYANPVMESWTAPENRPLVGRTLSAIFPAASVEGIVASLAEIANSGVAQHWSNFRFRRPAADGSPDTASFWDWNAIPLRSAAGTTSHILGVAVNETAQELVRERLQVSLDLALDLAEQPSPAAVIRQLLYRATETLGADRATLASIEGPTMIVEDSLTTGEAEPLVMGSRWTIADQPLVERAVTSREPARGGRDDPTLPARDTDLWNLQHVVMVPLILESEVTAVLGASRLQAPAFTDEEIATLQQIGSVAVLAVRNARLLQEAQEASRAKSDFLNLAAHELRTPLSVISGYLSMLQDGSFGPPTDLWRAPIDTVSAKAAELSDLVRSLLTAARIQSGTLPTTRQEMDLRHIVMDACARARPRAEMLGGGVVLDLPEQLVPVVADEEQIGRILDNLINNGLTYSDTPAEVQVDVTVADLAEVTVVDRGIGIDTEQQERVFERFFRADSAVTMHSGTGLGLYIARELAVQHGGTLELVRSLPHQGSTFVLRLPLAAERD
jgi:signal transduction histidine kinase